MAEKKTVKTAPKAAPKVAPKAAEKTTVKAPKVTVEILEKEIRAAAQDVYKERRAKNQAGDELSDWLKAEIVIKKKYGLL